MTGPSGLGPFPLPAIASPFQPRSESRRLWQRYRHSAAVTKLVNSAVSSLNQLSVSFASTCTYFSFLNSQASHSSFVSSSFSAADSTSAGTSSVVTAQQSRILARLFECSSRFLRRRTRDSPLDRFESDEPYAYLSDGSFDSLASHKALSSTSASSLYAPHQATAVPLVADRVSLPSQAGTASLLDLLPPDLTKQYSSPADLLRPADEVRTAPRAMMCSHSEYVKLLTRMSAAGMLDFSLEAKCVNGIFCVPKDGDSLRLIIDARPANAVFVEPDHVHLPTPDLVARLQAPKDSHLFVAKVDLDNFYHRLRLPDWLRPYFALPPVLSDELGLQERFGPGVKIFPVCTTLPMGWSHSVRVAQAVHENILNMYTRLSSCDRISFTTDLLLNRLRHQVYVDDLILYGPDKDDLIAAQDEYLSVVQSKGLPAKMSKVVRPTADAVECLGLEADGRELTVGLSATKLHQLCESTRAVLASGVSTGLDLSRLIGKWTWACLVARPALSVFSAVYRFVQCAGRRVYSLWPSVRRELSTMMGLTPLLYADFNLNWFPRTVATDASSSGQGVVVSSVTPEIVQQRLASDSGVNLSSVPSQPLLKHMSTSRWTTIVSSIWRRHEHINSLEIRAVSTAVRWALSFPDSIRSRLLVCSDSQVAIGAITKGRSSSRQLLPRLRSLAALLLASGLRLYTVWVPSEANPADEPSRIV